MLSAAIADTPAYVTIRADGHTLGRTCSLPPSRLTSRVQVHLAGFAAEHLLTGRRSRQFDREVGFAIISRQDPALRVAFAEFVESDGHRAVDQDVLAMNILRTAEAIRLEVERFYEAARHSLATVWSSVSAIADALLAHEELDRDGVDLAIGGADIYKPVFEVQHDRGLLLRGPDGEQLLARSTREAGGGALVGVSARDRARGRAPARK